MALIFRWMLRLFLGMAVVAGLGAVLVWYLASSSLPNYSATYEVPGARAPIEVVRDNAGVPHIFGQSDRDSWYGLGFVHAQDRLWQMVIARRTAQGRLSEVFGARTVEVDEVMRRLDLRSLSQQSLLAMRPDTLGVLDAYAAGVNGFIATVNAQSLGRGAPEFFLFPGSIEPWTAADSVALMKLEALKISPHMQQEILRVQMSLALDPARLADLLPEAPGPARISLPEEGAQSAQPIPDSRPPETNTRRTNPPPGLRIAPVSPDLPLSPFPARTHAGSANSFVASPERSAAGAALLANDIHVGLSAPSVFYLARIEFKTGGVIGATLPGIPAVLSGRSDYLGWGISPSYLDDLDIFLEEPLANDATRYVTPDGDADFRTRRETLDIKGAPNRIITLRWSENGPVVPPWHYDVGSVTPAGFEAALSWTLLSPNDTTLEAAIDIMRAATPEAAIDAGEGFIAPPVNLAVVNGDTIALKSLGAFPARNPDQVGQGRIPALGALARNRWRGRLPYADNPGAQNPPGGILGNTNNRLSDGEFPHHMSFLWGDSQRVQRWQHLMQSRRVHTRESFIEAQLDEVSTSARTLLALVGADLWFVDAPGAPDTAAGRRQTALALLYDWNGEMNQHLPEPLLYTAWMQQLQNRLIRDELGPLANGFSHLEPLFIERVFRDINGASVWCDMIRSGVVETCADMARLALDEALVAIGETVAGTPESLRWGDVHEARHDHPVLGGMSGLNWLVNIRQSTSGGDHSLMRGQTAGTGPAPFATIQAAGYRGVYDFADPDSSVFVISTGQSGHPLSRFYDNLGARWQRGEYIPMSLDPDLARAANAGIMMLVPLP